MDYGLLWTIGAAIFGAGVGWGTSEAAHKGAKEAAMRAMSAAQESARVAQAAHKRIDLHSERLTRVEAHTENHARVLEQSVSRIETSLSALHERLDSLMDRRTG